MDPSSVADQFEQDGLLNSRADDAPGRPVAGEDGHPHDVLLLWELSLAAGDTAETRRLVAWAHRIRAAEALRGNRSIG